MLETLLELGDVLAILSVDNSENLQKILFNWVEAEGIFVIDEGEFFWIFHEVVDDALTVQVDNLVDLLIGLEV